jgi:hypothetical protein
MSAPFSTSSALAEIQTLNRLPLTRGDLRQVESRQKRLSRGQRTEKPIISSAFGPESKEGDRARQLLSELLIYIRPDPFELARSIHCPATIGRFGVP